ncbi:hypothetical protein VaNZ11_008028 [Volvox africanus]|uniref:Uncharacterized protein n=1 Tax=Volvox africanus TaxID=51714 RepID=A0ABQ5S463_9CHLO|nr:hypothetical protein VaNZ11_008028 [Volvox africanus]
MVAHTEGCSRSGGRPFALVWSPIPLISWLMPFIGHIGICSSTGRTYDFAGPFTVNEDALLFGRPTRYLSINPAQAAKAASGRYGGGLPNVTALGRLAAEHGATEGGLAVEVLQGAAPPMAFPAQDPPGRTGAEFAAAAAVAARPERVYSQSLHGGTRLGGDDGVCCGNPGLADSEQGLAAAAAAATAVRTWDHRLTVAATWYRLLNYNLMTNNCHCFVAHFLNQVGYRDGGWDMVNLAALIFIRGRYTSLVGLMNTWLPWLVVVCVGGYFGQLLFLYSYLAVCTPLLTWFLLYTWCCWRDLSF